MRYAFAILFALAPQLVQPLPDAQTLLKKSAGATRQHRSYQYESDMSIDMTVGANPMKLNISSSVAGVNPDRMRVETKGQMGNTTMVCDGEHTWIYFSALKQYMKKDAIRGPQALLDSFGMGNMKDPSKFQKEAKTIREEALEVDGKKVDCWVVELRIDHLEMPAPAGTQLTDGVITLWIEKTTDFNRQMTMSGKMQVGPMPQPVEMKQRMLIRSLKFDEPLPDSLFQFTPPEGAKEVAEFSYPGAKKSSLAGKPAPAFQVKSLDGTAYDLSALKGKVVLLDFWATWCGPCRKEIPGIEKLHREFEDQGLVVIGMNAGEERETVEGFLKTAAISYPVVLAADTNVVAAYEVNAFPTYVVIGRDGTVAAYQVGGAGEQALRDLLGKAELKPKTPKP